LQSAGHRSIPEPTSRVVGLIVDIDVLHRIAGF
jgi:hypothetical protein